MQCLRPVQYYSVVQTTRNAKERENAAIAGGDCTFQGDLSLPLGSTNPCPSAGQETHLPTQHEGEVFNSILCCINHYGLQYIPLLSLSDTQFVRETCMYMLVRWPKPFVLSVSTRTEGRTNKPS